jgi:hypothetical protein
MLIANIKLAAIKKGIPMMNNTGFDLLDAFNLESRSSVTAFRRSS